VVGIAGFLATGMALLLVLLAVVPLALGWAAFRLGRAQKRLPMVLPLDRLARWARESPLHAVAVAFLFGVLLGRRDS